MQRARRQVISSLIAHVLLVIFLTFAPVAWDQIREPLAAWLGSSGEYQGDESWGSSELPSSFFSQY